jgi:hypothetical protein
MSAQLQGVSLARAAGATVAQRRHPHCSASAARRPAAARNAAARNAAAALRNVLTQELELSRRVALGGLLSGAAALFGTAPAAEAYATKRDDDGDFVTTDSGLRILELRPGTGDLPRKGGACPLYGHRSLFAPADVRAL